MIGSVIGALVVGLIGVFAIVETTVALSSNAGMKTGLSRGTLNSGLTEHANPELAGANKLWASVETLHPASLRDDEKVQPLRKQEGELRDRTGHREWPGH